MSRASVIQQKTGMPVRFEITEQTREAVQQWVSGAGLIGDTWLFPSRCLHGAHITTRQHVSMANNFDPLSANKIDPPGATKNQLSRLCFSR